MNENIIILNSLTGMTINVALGVRDKSTKVFVSSSVVKVVLGKALKSLKFVESFIFSDK